MSLQYLVKKLLFSCRDCRGITLIELLVALAVGSMVMVGALQVLTQILLLVPKAQASMLAMRQVQFAGHWVDRDATMAQVIIPTDNLSHNLSTTPLVMSHVNWGSDNITVTYYVDTDHKLQRQEVVKNKSAVTISSNQIQVADSITSLTAQYNQPDQYNPRRILTVTIIAQVGGAIENRTYKTSPRSY